MKNESFWVIGSGTLSLDDSSTLALLYQPLIGTDSHGLYLFLSALVNADTYQSELFPKGFLMDALNIKEKNLNEAFGKLEAVGLLSTYQKDMIYMYRLTMPLTPKQFFLDGILGSFLKSEIGESNFNLLFKRFSIPEVSREGYENITKSFDQVYQVKTLDSVSTSMHIVSRKPGAGVVINQDFKLDQLFEILPVRLQKKRIFTKKIQTQIASIMYVYGFTLEDMKQVLVEAYDEDHSALFYERINLVSSRYHEKHNGNESIEIDLKGQSEDRPKLSDFSPQDLISHYAPKMTNSAFALQTIRQFVERNAVDVGVINAVIIICLRIKTDLPNLNYLEKVLHSLVEKGITTEADAYEYIMKEPEYKKDKNPQYTKEKRVAPVPEWMDEFKALLESGD
ncbi:DnaD domain protein [Acholeplasma vituli]|uniref:DnaD domain protein n=1 Tax=Paracholeplasma vituli TaxID=69473 RepID=A0ABT2PWQ7_9MOLU|nr:DnaD domain protein [Paracholeplasma vituli]MCU0104764.1 DnaD domain protein [Paracholeplasma vituli]